MKHAPKQVTVLIVLDMGFSAPFGRLSTVSDAETTSEQP